MKNLFTNLMKNTAKSSRNTGGGASRQITARFEGAQMKNTSLISGRGAVDVPMPSYGASDEHPMSTRSASDGRRWKSRVWKYVAMIFCVLAMNVGQMWGTNLEIPLTNLKNFPLDYGIVQITNTEKTTISKNTLAVKNDAATFQVSTKVSGVYLKTISFTDANPDKNGGFTCTDNASYMTGPSSEVYTYTAPNATTTEANFQLTGSGGTAQMGTIVITVSTDDQIERLTSFSTISSSKIPFTSSAATTKIELSVPASSPVAVSSSKISVGSGGKHLIVSTKNHEKIKYIAVPKYQQSTYAVSATSDPVGTYSDNVWKPSSSTVESVDLTLTVSSTITVQEMFVIYTPSCTSISPSLSYDNSTLTLGGTTTANPMLTGNTGSGTVTYSSSNTSVATVNSSTGEVTAVAAGTTTITASIAANGGYCADEATAEITVQRDPVGSGHTLTWELIVSSSSESNVSATTDIGTGLKTPTSSYLTSMTNLTGVGVNRTTSGKNSNTGKIETPNTYDGSKYVTMTFAVASGYQFTPSSVSIKTVAVTTTKDLKFEISDAKGSYSVTKTGLSIDPAAATNTLDFSSCDRAFTGTVTVKIYVYGANDTYRLSTPLIITGTVAVEEVCETAPTVTAASNSAVAATTATVTCSGGISALGDCDITSYGFVLSTSVDPTISNTKYELETAYTDASTSFSKNLTGLMAGTTYYVRPYATNGAGTSYGTQTSFTTSADVTAPTLSSSTPADDATDVATSGNIVLTFSENVTIADASKFTLTGGAGTLNTASASASGASVTIPYSGLANSTTYTLSIAAGAVQDAAGNTFAVLSSISFTTAAAPIYYYKDATHYVSSTYKNPEGNEPDNTTEETIDLTPSWTICSACKTGVTSVVANGCQWDNKSGTDYKWITAYIKVPKGGDKSTKNITITLASGYTGTLSVKIGGFSSNPTVTLQPLVDAALGSAISMTTGYATVGGVATKENNFNELRWPLATAGGTYVLTVTSQNAYISQIEITTKQAATAQTVTVSPAGGGICSGSAATIGLAGSQSGVSYQLYRGSTAVGDPVVGTGSALTLTDTITTPGTYTVKSVENASYAAATMTGSVTVSILAATSITTQPITSVNAYAEAEFTLGSNMVVAGGGLSYQWYSYTSSEGAGEAALDGKTAATMTDTKTVAGTYYYKVKVSGSCGDPVYSNMITVTVVAANTLTYNANGGTGTMSNTVGSGSVTLRKNSYTKSGYEFIGWATSQANANAGTVAYLNGASYSLSADAELFAVWSPESYKFTPASSGDQPAVNATVSSSTGGTMIYTPLSGTTLYLTYDSHGLLFGGSSNCATTVTLDCAIKQGTVFTATLVGPESANTGRGIKLNTGSEDVVQWKWDAAEAYEEKVFQYVVPAEHALIGAKTFKLIRIANAYLKSLTVTNTALPTYDLTVSVNNGKYGSVSPASVTDIPSGTMTSSSENTFTVNGTTVTATPTTATAEYTYAFDSWSGLPAMVTENATVTANFTRTANSYTLAWNTNGGSDLAGTPTSGTTAFGTPLTKPTDPTKSNYTFAGWNTANDGSDTNYTGEMTMPASDATYYAKWTQAVTLNANTANHGSGANQSATAVWNATGLTGFVATGAETNYTVIGYFTDATGGTKVLNADGSFAADDVTDFITDGKWSRTAAAPTLYAQLVESLSVTYNGNEADSGDAPEDDHTYTSESNIMIKDNTGDLVKDGYIFTGWNTAAEGTGVYYPVGATIKINSNTTLYAVWDEETCETLAEGTQNAEHTEITATTGTIAATGTEAQDNYIKISGGLPKGFTVTAKEGKAPIAVGDKLTVTVYNKSKSATDFGFILKTTSHTGSIASQSEGDIVYTLVAGDIEENGTIVIGRSSSNDRYHAVKLERCTRTNKTVTFNLNGHGEDIEAYVGVPSGSKIVAPIAPSAVGYDFGGWWEDADCETTQFDFSTGTITADKTLYAKWTPIDYTVTYSAPANSNSYTIQVAGGAAGSADKIANYGQTITLTANPASSAYVFSSWTIKKASDDTDITNAVSFSGQTATATFTMPAYSVTVEAAFEDAYALTYNDNGVTAAMPEPEHHPASAITLSSTVPTADDCVFLGWNTAADGSDNSHTFIAAGGAFTMPAEEEVLYAQWGPKIASPVAAEAFTLATGRKATLSVKASTCSGTLSYQWYKDGVEIDGATSAAYVVDGAGLTAGTDYAYTCRVSTDAHHYTTSPAFTVTGIAECGWEVIAGATRTSGAKTVASYEGSLYKEAIFNTDNDGKISGGKYVSLTLTSGNYFQNGDTVAVTVTEASDQGDKGLHIFVGTSTPGTEIGTLAYANTSANAVNKVVLANVPAETSSITIHRSTSTTQQNWFVDAISVSRYSCPGTNESKAAGNWNDPTVWAAGKVPTVNDRVYIDRELTVNTTEAKAKEVVIMDGGKLIVAPNQALIVTGTITNAEGNPTTAAELKVESSSTGNGTLIFNNSNHAAATVQMYSKAAIVGSTWNWQYIGSPFLSANALYNYYGSYMYKWNAGWEVVENGANVDPWVGYSITYETANTYVMEGTLVETSTIDLTVPDKPSTVFANSWTAPIYIPAMADALAAAGGESTVYLFNTGYNPDGVSMAGGDRYAAGTYLSVPCSSAELIETPFIASMQGFLVKNTTSPRVEKTLTLDYNTMVRPTTDRSVVGGRMHAPRRGTEEAIDEPEVLKLTVSGTNYDDVLYLLEHESFNTGFDNGWDGTKMGSNAVAPRMYTKRDDGVKEAVSAVPDLEGKVINFRAGEDDIYTFHFMYGGNAEALYLYDVDTQEYTRVLTGNTYTFKAEDKVEHDRFILTRYAPQMPTGVENVQSGDVQSTKVRKLMIDGVLYIIRSGRIYSAEGMLVK